MKSKVFSLVADTEETCLSTHRIVSLDHYESITAFLCLLDKDSYEVITYDFVSKQVTFRVLISESFETTPQCFLTTPTTVIISEYGSDSLFVDLMTERTHYLSSYVISKQHHIVHVWDHGSMQLERFDYDPKREEWKQASLQTEFESTRNRILSTRYLFTKPKYPVSLLFDDDGLRWIMNRLRKFEYVFYSYDGVLWSDPTHGHPITIRVKGKFLHYCISHDQLWLVFSKTIVKVCIKSGVFQYSTPKHFTRIFHAEWNSAQQQWRIMYESKRGTKELTCCRILEGRLYVQRRFLIPDGVIGLHEDRVYVINEGKVSVVYFYTGGWNHRAHCNYPQSFQNTTKELLLCWNRSFPFSRDIQHCILEQLSNLLY